MFENLLARQRLAPAQFLVASARLSSVYGGREHLVFMPERGTISRLGFAKGHGTELFGYAPRAEPAAQGQFYHDKFIGIKASDQSGHLGSAELKETHVYDFYYRCSIDFTGIELVVTLQCSAFEQYQRFIGTARVPAGVTDPEAWHGDLLLLIPAPLFEFPEGRGSASPYPPAETPQAKVGRLRMIKSFRFATIDILKIGPRDDAGEFRVPDISNIPSEQLLRLR
jgi:hypothetical protein